MSAPTSPRRAPLKRLFSQPAIHTTLFEDRVFGHADWEKHRSAAWRHRVEPMVFFRVAVGFAWQLLLVVLISVAVGVLHTLLPGHTAFLSESRLSTPYTMITFALSLLLVFKTNSSYSRWWEGRIIWGQIVNFGRNYTRQALMWFPPERPELRAAAVRWAAAAPRVLLAHLREGLSVAGEVAGILTPQEVEWLGGWSNPPLGAGTALGQLVAAAGLAPQLQAELQRQVELYTNCAGGCERIFKTPIPPAYARHTSRFLMLYVVTSPVLLWSSTGWLTPLVAGLVAFLLLGVENIGVQVEEPFHVLPLYDICRALEANIRELERAFAFAPAAGSDGNGAATHISAATGAGGAGAATTAAAGGGGAVSAVDLAAVAMGMGMAGGLAAGTGALTRGSFQSAERPPPVWPACPPCPPPPPVFLQCAARGSNDGSGHGGGGGLCGGVNGGGGCGVGLGVGNGGGGGSGNGCVRRAPKDPTAACLSTAQ